MLAVGFFPVTYSKNLDGQFACTIEKDAIVATTETVSNKRRFEFLYIPCMRGTKPVDAMQDVQCKLPSDTA